MRTNLFDDGTVVAAQGPYQPDGSEVVGTGFFVDKTGDFITAGHVIDSLDDYKRKPHVTNARLSAIIRLRDGMGSGREFAITDRDQDHDIVLCHIPGVDAVTPEKSRLNRLKKLGPNALMPFASLAISQVEPKTGEFALVSGFPLGSWTPTVQFAMVAATNTVYPGGTSPTIRKDRGKLLQISVAANEGNSGGPVIDLERGTVIGVVDQLVQAPVHMGQHQSPLSGSAGRRP